MAKECYLEIDGKRTKLTDEQLKALGLYEEPKKSPFDRVEKEKSYYLIDNCGCVASIRDYCWGADKTRHDIANYCTNREIMQQRAWHETLNRLLWRFSMENGYDKINWHNGNYDKYLIYFDHSCSTLYVAQHSEYDYVGTICFVTREIAARAIEEIVKPFMVKHPDFIW